MDDEHAITRSVRVLHFSQKHGPVELWGAHKEFEKDEKHDGEQFEQLRSELDEAARVAWEHSAAHGRGAARLLRRTFAKNCLSVHLY